MSNLSTRRSFLMQGISTGFAMATLPTAAWAILTNSEDLEAGSIQIPTPNGTMPAYRAMPKGVGPFPVLLVIHEIFGVHEYIQDICRRLAKSGYMAVSPSLYFRQGDVTRMENIQQIISSVVSKVPQKQVWSDLDSTLQYLGKDRKADLSKLGITGFCWGGNVVWTYCSHNPKVKAGVAWYGRLVIPDKDAGTIQPIDLGSNLKVPVLGLYGGKDKSIPLEDIDQMRATLKKGNSGSEIIVFPKAEHGFHADYRPSYHEPSAKEGWEKMLNWFKKFGVKT